MPLSLEIYIPFILRKFLLLLMSRAVIKFNNYLKISQILQTFYMESKFDFSTHQKNSKEIINQKKFKGLMGQNISFFIKLMVEPATLVWFSIKYLLLVHSLT